MADCTAYKVYCPRWYTPPISSTDGKDGAVHNVIDTIEQRPYFVSWPRLVGDVDAAIFEEGLRYPVAQWLGVAVLQSSDP